MTELTLIPAAAYKERYNLKAFVETGCFHGDGIQAARMAGFSSLYSCDLNQKYIDECYERFGHRAVKIFYGQSHHVLPQILNDNKLPTLFWLDAHLPTYHDVDQPTLESKWPLFDELKVIKKLKVDVYRDVIVCDDVCNILTNNKFAFKASEASYEQCVEFIDYLELIKMFSDTHDFNDTVIPNVGVFIPKELP